MVECSSIETPDLSTSPLDNQQFRLNKINEIKYYFIADIREGELIIKNLVSILPFVIVLINL